MKLKRLAAGMVAAVMMLTAVATPLGDNLPAVRGSVSVTASAAEISTDGYYTLKNLYAGKMLNVRGSYSTSNTNVTVYETDGTTGQQFRFIKSGSNYVLEPKCAPTCALNVYGTSASNGANVNIWTKSGNSTQAWVMEYSSSSSAYIIRSAANTNLVLTATGTSNSSNVALAYYSSGNKSQLWAAEKISTSAPSSGGVITTQSIQAVLDKYNYRNGMYWSPERNDSSLQTTGYMAHTKSCGITYRYNGKQCWGFANFVMHAVTGTNVNPSNGNNGLWVKLYASQVNELRVGDIVRIQYENDDRNGHSGVVLSIDGTKCTFVQEFGASAEINIGPLASKKYGTHSTLASMKSKNYLYFVYRYIGSHTHSYGSWYTTTSATCTSGGKEERKCSCGAVETRSTSALGHNYGYWETDRNATCTEDGTEVRICSRCGGAEYRNVSALGHDFSSEWTTDIQPTCIAEGSKSRHCTRCDEKTDVTTIEKTYHSYNTDIIHPTFEDGGYMIHTCSVCGDSYIDNYTEKLSLEPVTGVKLGGRAADALRINWNENTLANGYIIEMYKSGKWTRIAKIKDSSTTTYRATGLKAGTAYKFRVKAYVLYGDTPLYSDYSATVAARTNPSVIKGAKLGGGAADALRINWTKNASADGYIVEMYQGNKWVRVAKITNSNTTTFRKAGLKASTVYKFRVRAYKMSGSTALYGNYSATVTARTNPSIVKGITAAVKTSKAIALRWDKNTSAQGYIVEMYKGGKWVRAAKITDNGKTLFKKAGLKANTVYRFRVKAYHMSGKTALYGNYGSVSGRTAK